MSRLIILFSNIWFTPKYDTTGLQTGAKIQPCTVLPAGLSEQNFNVQKGGGDTDNGTDYFLDAITLAASTARAVFSEEEHMLLVRIDVGDVSRPQRTTPPPLPTLTPPCVEDFAQLAAEHAMLDTALERMLGRDDEQMKRR